MSLTKHFQNSTTEESLSFIRLRSSRRLSHQIIIFFLSLSLFVDETLSRVKEREREGQRAMHFRSTFTRRLDFRRVMMNRLMR